MSLSSETSGANLKPTPDLQIRLFGPLSVRVEGAPLPLLRTRKGLWLLALLVLKHPHPVDRTWLAGTLWPDSDHSASLKNLRNTLAELRHALGTQENRLQSPTSGTLSLEMVGAEVDLLAFDAGVKRGDHASLTEAVALYLGTLLEGCDEEWVVWEREQRQQSCLEALEYLAHGELQAGQTAEAIRHLRTCIGIDPFRETAQGALMTALAATGDFAGVTQVYREFRLQLHEQLQTQPAAQTLALYQKIRVRARQIAAGGAAPLSAPSLPHRLDDNSAAAPSEESEAPPVGRRQNLPPALTSFIGREQACAEIQELLEQTRLLTLTGAGGSGKTRLALEVAGERVASYADGVWLVELAALADPVRVVQAAATALEIREQPNVPLLQTLVATLEPRSLLLLLDNCEHLLGACGELAAALLRGCPSVRLLATSRERLGVTGEQMYRVPSLSLPDLNTAFSVESIHRYESVRLFVARARLIRSDFRVSTQDAEAVAQVCHRLDGIPLAIELAAARMRSLSVEDLKRRLDDRFHLLTGGDRSALPRQQTLRGLIDWSYDLLNEPEKRLLQQLSVFAGGWTLEAAEEIAKRFGLNEKRQKPGGNRIETWEVLDLLTSLVDKSLVIAEERDGSARYRLLETVRHYAADRREESGESEEVRTHHLAYFLALAEEAEPKLQEAEQVKWLQRLETEHENLRGALGWSLKVRDEIAQGSRLQTQEEPDSISPSGAAVLRLCGALSRFWWTRGHLLEGLEWCVRALETASDQTRNPERAKALNGAGVLAWMQGDYRSARAYHEESLSIRRETGDPGSIAASLIGLGNVANYQGDYGPARTYYEESLALRREIGDRRGIAQSLNNLGMVASFQGDSAFARASWEESLSLYREIGDRNGIAPSLNNLGAVAAFQGDYRSARAYHEESLALCREIGDRGGIAQSFHNLGTAASSQGDYDSARAYWEESLTICREIGDRRGVAKTLNNLGAATASQGDYGSAGTYHEESLAIRREIGDRGGIAQSLHNLGGVASSQGDYGAARASHGASLALRREIGDRGDIAYSLEAFAELAAHSGEIEQATTLRGAAEALREEIGTPPSPGAREACNRAVAAAMELLGEEAFTTAWAKGRAMTLEEAITLALKSGVLKR